MENLGFIYINLDKDESRRQKIEHQFSSLNITNYHRTPGVVHSNPKIGCCLAHINAIYNAYKSPYDYVIIMEDDLLFEEGFKCVEVALKYLPKDWEIFQCHTINPYLLKELFKRLHLRKSIYNKILKGYFMSAACYLLNRKGLKTFIDKMILESSNGQFLKVDLSRPNCEAEELVYRYLNSYTILIPFFNTLEESYSNISNNIEYRSNNTENMLLYSKLMICGVEPKEFNPEDSYSILPYNLHWINDQPTNQIFLDRVYKEHTEFLVFLHSDLADRLFQYCSVYAIAKCFNANFKVFMNNENKYSDFFRIARDFPPYKEKNLLDDILSKENSIHTYNTLIMDNIEYYHSKKGQICTEFVKDFKLKDTPKTYIFSGLYRDENFFIDYKADILNMFQENSKEKILLDLLNNFYNDMICIHINLKNASVNLYNYYKNAIIAASDIVSNIKFIIVSNDNRDEIYKKYPYISGIPLLFLKDKNEITELFFMTRCRGVICSNNLFSWWGAWLNKNSKPLIYIPNKWFKNDDTIIHMKNSIILDI
jgi:GR25 family glycosyltransferase involved in LPS biosynthesis